MKNFYMALTNRNGDVTNLAKPDGTLTPYNYSIWAYPTKKERQSAIDEAWDNDKNGIVLTRKQVELVYGKDFIINNDGYVSN